MIWTEVIVGKVASLLLLGKDTTVTEALSHEIKRRHEEKGETTLLILSGCTFNTRLQKENQSSCQNPKVDANPPWGHSILSLFWGRCVKSLNMVVMHRSYLSWAIQWSSSCCSAARRTGGRLPSGRPRSRLRTRKPCLHTPWPPPNGRAWEEEKPSPTGWLWCHTCMVKKK